MSADLTATSFAKITYFDSPMPLASLVEQIGPEVGVLPSSVPDMGDSAGEIHLTWVHKAVGMKLVTEHLGLDQAQVIAIGDGLNDVEMLEYAGVGVAIEGSDRRVLAAADHVAPGPHQEGLRSAFTALGLLPADPTISERPRSDGLSGRTARPEPCSVDGR